MDSTGAAEPPSDWSTWHWQSSPQQLALGAQGLLLTGVAITVDCATMSSRLKRMAASRFTTNSRVTYFFALAASIFFK